MREGFDIFVGGPMGDTADDGAGTPFSDHISRMQAALNRVRDEINSESQDVFVRVNTPEGDKDNAGMITSTVFGMIDTTELGVMDVSSGSPSVMYELAMMHALGIPTIPIVLRPKEGTRKVPFYLKDTYQADVSDFEEETLYTVLKPMVRRVIFGGATGNDPADNPMTQYYGLPLLDISASTGLATGYFHNFLRHLIKVNDGVLAKRDDILDRLVVLQPESLSDAEGLKQKTERRLAREGIEMFQVGGRDGQVYEDREQARGQMLLYAAGRYIFDAPAPLAAQEASPRFRRLRKMMVPASAQGPAGDSARELLHRFEQRMIEGFMSTLRRLPDAYPGTNPDYLTTMTLDEFVELLKSEA